MRFDNITDKQCKAYNDAIRFVSIRAHNENVPYWVYRKGETFYVRKSGEPMPEGARKVCIAARWDDKTVQLRFDGAWSEFVNF